MGDGALKFRTCTTDWHQSQHAPSSSYLDRGYDRRTDDFRGEGNLDLRPLDVSSADHESAGLEDSLSLSFHGIQASCERMRRELLCALVGDARAPLGQKVVQIELAAIQDRSRRLEGDFRGNDGVATASQKPDANLVVINRQDVKAERDLKILEKLLAGFQKHYSRVESRL